MLADILPFSDIDDNQLFSLLADVNFSNVLPFSLVYDDELVDLFASEIVAVDYGSLHFNPCELFDKYSIDLNPGLQLNSGILHKRQLCSYYDVDQYIQMISANAKCRLSLVSLNIRSIPKNLEEFILEFEVVSAGIDIYWHLRRQDSLRILNLYIGYATIICSLIQGIQQEVG